VKVLFVTTAYPTPESPVAGVFVKEHARAAALHADVGVLHLDRSHEHRGLPRVERVAGEEFPTWRVTYPWRPTALSMPLHLLAAAQGWRAVDFDPDVVHAHFFLAGAPAVLLARKTPVVITEQWSIFLPEDPMQLTPTLRRIARFAYGRAARVLPASDALRRGIEAEGISARFTVVPNVVDTSLFHPGARRDGRLLAAGLLYEAKGYEFLLDAVARVEGVRLDIVGDGPLRAQLEAQVEQLGIGDRVRFLGILPKAEVAKQMSEHELFAITSRYDNNPCVVIEALASGLPVVATAVGGLPELVDETNGRLARPQDPESIAAELRSALAASFDRAAIAARARERFGREAIGARLASIYSEVTR
jgi:glycosyltransferase involved in cell wall biosynthesis